MKYYTMGEIAKMTGLSRQAIFNRLRAGILAPPAVNLLGTNAWTMGQIRAMKKAVRKPGRPKDTTRK